MSRKLHFIWITTLFILTAVGISAAQETPRAEILWDTWGVPHIYAETELDLAYGFGWAQMHAHGNLILGGYAEARGQAAAVLGVDALPSDVMVLTLDVPGVAQDWHAAQTPEFRDYLDAFADGMTAYVAANPDVIDDPLETLLPITGVDVLAYTQWAFHYNFVAATRDLPVIQQYEHIPGSNAWTIAPSHSENGAALLMGNPHLSWQLPKQRLFEAQLTAPTYQFYGATMIGFPVLALGFNEQHGWTHTNNTIDGTEVYELTLQDDGYLFDGEVRPFDTTEYTVRVLGGEDHTFTARRSVHGPVLAQKDGQALALRVAGIDRPRMLQQWLDMAKAESFTAFEDVLRRLQLPMFNVVYADRDGNTMLLFNGLVPVRSGGTFIDWLGTIPGDTSTTIWTDYHTYDELPKVINPASGWLANSNEPPWMMTVPYPLDPADYPSYIAPQMVDGEVFRPQHGHGLLLSDDSLTLDEMLALRYDTGSQLAARIVDDLLLAAENSDDPAVQGAAAVLAAWDGHYAQNSQGAALFHLWYFTYLQTLSETVLQAVFAEAGGVNGHIASRYSMYNQIHSTHWNPAAEPFTTPDGLADPAAALAALAQAANILQSQGVALDATWGDVARMRVAEVDLPARGGSGNLGVFRMLETEIDTDGRLHVVHGDTFVFGVEFGKSVNAQVLMTYGNASQRGSVHVGDQLELYALDHMRPALLTREAVEAELAHIEVLR